MYTIGQVSEMFGLPVSTLRYYDKEGLFPQMERASGAGDRGAAGHRVPQALGAGDTGHQALHGLVHGGELDLSAAAGAL